MGNGQNTQRRNESLSLSMDGVILTTRSFLSLKQTFQKPLIARSYDSLQKEAATLFLNWNNKNLKEYKSRRIKKIYFLRKKNKGNELTGPCARFIVLLKGGTQNRRMHGYQPWPMRTKRKLLRVIGE